MRLIHGDCLEKLVEVADASVSLVFCDLPYGVTVNKWDTPINLGALWKHLLRVGKPICAYVFTATQPFATALINSQPSLFRYDLVWLKHLPSDGSAFKRRPLRYHETILVFYRHQPTYNPQMITRTPTKWGDHKKTEGINANTGQRGNADRVYTYTNKIFPKSYLENMNTARCTSVHPTQKPVALLEWLIKTYTNPGDTVLDPCAGSFTTAVAAYSTGRDAVCIEKDAAYFDVGQKRLADAIAGPPQSKLPLGMLA